MASDSEPPPSSVTEQGRASAVDLKRAELDPEAEELRHRREGKKRWFMVPLVAAALFTGLGTVLGAVLQGYFNYGLEQKKFESVLIQRALEQREASERAKELLFLVDIGAITNLNAQKIKELANDSTRIPSPRIAAVEDCPPCPPCAK